MEGFLQSISHEILSEQSPNSLAEQKCPVWSDSCLSFCHHSLSRLDIPLGYGAPLSEWLCFSSPLLLVFASPLAELLLLKAVGKELVNTLLLASGVAGSPWHSSARRCLNPFSASVITWPSLCGSVPQFLFFFFFLRRLF